MVWDPPKQKVNVTRMIIYILIPILSIYAAWRIQKFWLILLISIAISTGISVATMPALLIPDETISGIVFSIASYGSSIVANILLVRYFARKYNEKIEINENS